MAIKIQGTTILDDSRNLLSGNTVTAASFVGPLTGNATTATTLANTRTLWGQNFNGSANVTGNLTSVGNITGSGAITITAGGTNQSITLTPSGTGTVNSPTFNATSTTNGGFQGIDADSVTTPSFTWSGDLNTGMYRSAEGTVAFTANGTATAYISQSGLQVQGDLAVQGGQIFFNGLGGTSGDYLNYSTQEGITYFENGVATWRLSGNGVNFINGGNLGIGTTSPGAKLDANGSIRTSSQFISTVATGTAPITVNSTTTVTNLSADTVDGIHASSFLRSDADNSSATGGISTSALFIEAGRGTGSIAMTANDGGGNANITFNHRNRVPDISGNMGRIDVNVDSTTNALMRFSLKSGGTAGNTETLTEALALAESGGVITVSAPTFNATSTTAGGFQGIAADAQTAPSFTWTGDLDTGMYRQGTNSIGFTTGNFERVRINSSGLTVISGDLTVPDYIYHTNDTNTFIRFPANDTLSINTNGSERFRITSTGEIGIGTSTPRDQLHIYGTGQTTLALFDAGSRGGMIRVSGVGAVANTGGAIIFSSQQGDTANSLGYAAIRGMLLNGAGNTTGDLVISTRNATSDTFLSERLRITSAGRLGVNTATPSQPLDVNGVIKTNAGILFGSTESYMYENAADSIAWRIGADGPFVTMGDAGGNVVQFFNASGGLGLGSENTERVRINSTGLQMISGVISSVASSSRDKLRVWNDAAYTIGMQNSVTFGSVTNDYAMTFQMNNSNNRGFWWGDQGHTTAQGAMSLSTQGHLSVASAIRVGYGESDTTKAGTNGTLDVSGNVAVSNAGSPTLSITSTNAQTPTLEFLRTGGAGYRITTNTDPDLRFVQVNSADAEIATPMTINNTGEVFFSVSAAAGIADGTSDNPGSYISHLGFFASQRNNGSNIFLTKASGFTSGTFASFIAAGTTVGSITTSGSSTSYNTSTTSGLIGSTSTSLALRTNSTDRLVIDSIGEVGIGTTAPSALLHVVGTTSTARIRLSSTENGVGDILNDSSTPALELTAAGMNTSVKFTPAIKFGSTDPQFTTVTPKFGAAIVGEANETYGADTDGGMDLVFMTVPANPGNTAVSMTERMRITGGGVVDFRGNAGNLNIFATGPTDAPNITMYGNANTTNAMSVINQLTNGPLRISSDPDNVYTNSEIQMQVDGTTRLLVTTTGATVTGTASMTSYQESVFAITDGTVSLNPNNGSIQTWTLGANRTPSQTGWNAGQSITLLVDDGAAYTITWSTLGVVWKTDGGTAPKLNTTGYTVIVLWKVGSTIYGARVGDA